LTTAPAITLDELADLPALIRRYGEPIGGGLVRVEIRLCLTVPENDNHLPYREQETLRAFRQVQRDQGMPVSSRALAARLWVSQDTARRRVVALERRGVVSRVGQRGGWVLSSGENS
jgi:hypothetical protein